MPARWDPALGQVDLKLAQLKKIKEKGFGDPSSRENKFLSIK